MSVIVSPNQIVDQQSLPDSQEVRLRLPSNGETTVFALGDWFKSQGDQRRIVAHTASQWQKQVRRLSDRVRHPIKLTIVGLEAGVK